MRRRRLARLGGASSQPQTPQSDSSQNASQTPTPLTTATRPVNQSASQSVATPTSSRRQPGKWKIKCYML